MAGADVGVRGDRCFRRPGLLVLVGLSGLGAAFAIAGPGSSRGAAQASSEEGEVQSPPRMDLAALTRQAQRDYPGVSAARARIRAAQAQLDEAWVSPFFQSTLTAGVGVVPSVRGTPILSPDPQVPLDNPWYPALGVGIEGAIPLFTFGKLPAARDAARAGIRAAQADEARVRARLRYDVRRAYFALQLALDLQQMLDEGLPRIRQARDELERRLAEGATDVSDFDRYRLVAALTEVEARGAEAERLQATARAALRVLTGVERFRVPECPIEPIEFELRGRQWYAGRARRQRPEARMLAAALEARRAALEVAERSVLPDVAFAYRVQVTWAPGVDDQTNPFVIDPANYTTATAAVVLRWSLDFGGHAYRRDRQEALLEDTRAQSEEATRGMDLEVSEAYAALVAARRQVETWQSGRRSSRSWFIAAAQAGDVGAVEARELVDAARAYFTARLGHLTAIYELNVAAANLSRVSGSDVVERWEPPCE